MKQHRLNQQRDGPEPTKDGIAHLSLHPEGSIRARLDFTQVIWCSIVPSVVFAVVAAVLTSHLNYSMTPVAWIIVLFCLLPAVAAAYLARKARQAEEPAQQAWMMFFCGVCAMAWLLACIVGVINFSSNLKPFYDMLALNYYPSVDPAASGEATIDAGRLLFVEGSKLDLSKAMGVRVGSTYCVAPVVNPHTNSSAVEYDYWAVGINCCNSVQPEASFKCPMVNDPHANAAMRSTDDGARPFFRMAIQEAEATYKIRAKHPIYLNWMHDPAAELASWRETAMRTYIKFTLSFLVFMIFISMSAGLYMSTQHMESRDCEGTGFDRYCKENPDHDPLCEEDLQVVTRR
jgi:hypothetical protein